MGNNFVIRDEFKNVLGAISTALASPIEKERERAKQEQAEIERERKEQELKSQYEQEKARLKSVISGLELQYGEKSKNFGKDHEKTKEINSKIETAKAELGQLDEKEEQRQKAVKKENEARKEIEKQNEEARLAKISRKEQEKLAKTQQALVAKAIQEEWSLISENDNLHQDQEAGVSPREKTRENPKENSQHQPFGDSIKVTEAFQTAENLNVYQAPSAQQSLNLYADLLLGLVKCDFLVNQQPQAKSSSNANPLREGNLTKEYRAQSAKFKNEEQQDLAKLRGKKSEFHKLLDDVVTHVAKRSPEKGEEKTIRSLIYCFLDYCAGDDKSFEKSFVRIVNEGLETGSYTGLGHASGNSLERLNALQKMLEQFKSSETETRHFQTVNSNDLKEFLSEHYFDKIRQEDRQSAERITYYTPKDDFDYVKDLVIDVITSPIDKNFKIVQETAEKIKDFIAVNTLAMLSCEPEITAISRDDVENFLKADSKQFPKEYPALSKIIKFSQDLERGRTEVEASLGAISLGEFRDGLEKTYEDHRKEIEQQETQKQIFLAKSRS